MNCLAVPTKILSEQYPKIKNFSGMWKSTEVNKKIFGIDFMRCREIQSIMMCSAGERGPGFSFALKDEKLILMLAIYHSAVEFCLKSDSKDSFIFEANNELKPMGEADPAMAKSVQIIFQSENKVVFTSTTKDSKVESTTFERTEIDLQSENKKKIEEFAQSMKITNVSVDPMLDSKIGLYAYRIRLRANFKKPEPQTMRYYDMYLESNYFPKLQIKIIGNEFIQGFNVIDNIERPYGNGSSSVNSKEVESYQSGSHDFTYYLLPDTITVKNGQVSMSSIQKRIDDAKFFQKKEKVIGSLYFSYKGNGGDPSKKWLSEPFNLEIDLVKLFSSLAKQL